MKELVEAYRGEMLDKRLEELVHFVYRCECGQEHRVDLQKVVIEEGALCRVHEVIAELQLGTKALLIADDRTYEAAGERLYRMLSEQGLDITLSVNHEKNLYADEKALGKALIDIEPDTEFIIVVGAGTLNDTARYISYKLNLPYLVVATAPSMDGYASTGSPLLVEGFKKTFLAVSPAAIIGDLDILAAAPREMMAAGFGDMLAKITALCDWKLAAAVEQEHYCPLISQMMVKALSLCINHVQGLAEGKKEAVGYVMEGLVLSGIAMQMLGNSRPASGSEHHMSHYWEMLHVMQGHDPELHGVKVSIATLFIISMYHKLLELPAESLNMIEKTEEQLARWESEVGRCYGPLAQEVIGSNRKLFLKQEELEGRRQRLTARWEKLKAEFSLLLQLAPEAKQLLELLGAPVSPQQIGIDRDTTRDALLYAKEVRGRYTILQLADQLGLLESFAEELLQESGSRTDTVYWQAHRGGGAYEAPDNTMAANRYAWGLGGIPEADIRTTKDGVIICLHDETIARTTTAPNSIARLPVSELTYDEVRKWDAGSKFDPKFAGERIPSLEEALQEMQGYPERVMYLDLKEVDLRRLGELIDRYEVNRQVIFTHNRQENCKRMKQITEGVRTMLWVGGSGEAIKQTFSSALQSGFEGLDQIQLHLKGSVGSAPWPYELEPEFLSYALDATKKAGIDLEVLPFQFNRETMQELLQLGIRWYATDEPARFLECIGKS
jgi:glycerol dehydrogenase-like iron-containing ADH family enzyme/glycerophosphoryl diester phosphodiesterase